MLRRRHHAQTKIAGETKRRQKANEVLRLGEHPAGSVHRSFENLVVKNQETKAKNQGPRKMDSAPVDIPSQSASFVNLCWLISRTVRQAGQMHKHVGKLLAAQRDILSPQATAAIE